MFKILEAAIYFTYLTLILYMARYMIRNSKSENLYKIYGSLAYVLTLADGIYMIPRVYAILTTGIEDNLSIMGWARIGSSIIVTIFFLLVYDLYNVRFSKKENKRLDRTFTTLGLIRFILILLSFNDYFQLVATNVFSLIRFIPLVLMGLLLFLVINLHSKKHKDKSFERTSYLVLIGLFTTEPYMYFVDKPAFIAIISGIRILALAAIVLIGYKEVKDMNVLSRY